MPDLGNQAGLDTVGSAQAGHLPLAANPRAHIATFRAGSLVAERSWQKSVRIERFSATKKKASKIF
jgi:hypothetical protein